MSVAGEVCSERQREVMGLPSYLSAIPHCGRRETYTSDPGYQHTCRHLCDHDLLAHR